MRRIFAIALLGAGLAFAGFAVAQNASAPQGVSVSVATVSRFSIESTIGELLTDPKAKAVLEKYTPDLITDPNVSLIVQIPLKQLAQYPQANVTPDMLADIDADLGKL